ncbi:Interferon alpha/beta receptor 1a Membrane-associated type I interferon receptor [Channa argus]|uniref:Interferon alpha/beta receptor 1a Membrane-associated type I interferon receptor n=1 Tax=Channa argus TaxID=215402 RepID=A0A6G1PXY6_CHAAH|nr:Interferon alpha/beta receptor 1a Membrane-associated type I interferon receptor [Channa argus]
MMRSLVIFLCVQLIVQAGAALEAPQNLTLITLNTNYTLSWNWHQSPAESQDVTFTTQYIGTYKLKNYKKIPNWSTVCEETSHRSCDFTRLNLHYQAQYTLRVRANANVLHSDWVETEFCPEKQAVLGPPTVHLAPAGNDLDVFILDPLTSTNTSMKEHIPKLYYNILYWDKSADTKTKTLNNSVNQVTLPNLKSWTWYCVKVQSCYETKSSTFTSPLCTQTKGKTPWWIIFLSFLGSLVVLLSLYSCFLCCKTIKATFYPSNQLPTHLKKYLCHIPGSDIPHLLTLDPESELVSDNVTVCAKPTILEFSNSPLETLLFGPPSGLESDSSRYSREDSSSSGDSGVYSTGGGLVCLERKDTSLHLTSFQVFQSL